MQRMWEGWHVEDDAQVLINVDYDEVIDLYIVEVTMGLESNFKTFTPHHVPVDGLMNIQDVEKAIKSANKLLKRLKDEARKEK